MSKALKSVYKARNNHQKLSNMVTFYREIASYALRIRKRLRRNGF